MTEIAVKLYNGDEVIYQFDDGRRMTKEEFIEYYKTHFVVVI